MFTSAFRMTMTCGFDPRSLAPILWVDGADPATMWDATSGGSLVAPNGAIARWEDKSGNGYHLTQATSGARPTRQAAMKNGLNVVNFNGANGISTAGNVAFTNNREVSAFYVTKISGAGIILETSENFNYNSALLVMSEVGDKFTAVHHSFDPGSVYSQAQETTGSATSYHIWSTTHNANLTSGEVSFLRDGNARAQSNLGYDSDLSTLVGIHPLFIGSRSGLTYPITGEIAEIIVYNRVLTGDERKSVERYLSAKWAIALA